MSFFVYIGISFAYSFLILSIFFRELPWLPYGGIFRKYLYTGRRAVFLSVGLLFVVTLILFIKIDGSSINFFDFATFFQSSLFGLPIAIITHRLLTHWVRHLSSIEDEQGIEGSDKNNIIVGKMKLRKITVGSLILWMIPGLIAGAIFSIPLYFISESILLAGMVEAVIACFVVWLGARANWV